MMHPLVRVLLLVDYNTRVVMFGTVMLGIAGGVMGVFLLLRRRALLADAVSHAALPGIAVAFLVSVAAGGTGRSLPVLLLGALLAGLAGMGSVLAITRWTRLSQDAALGIVLSVFFGLGTALLGIIQKMQGAAAAGLNSFIFGKTASMIRQDALLMGAAALVIILAAALLFKEFRLVTFDAQFAAGDGWPVQRLDALLMALVVGVTIVGLQAVGVVLVVAILIIPAATARFWTDRLVIMVPLAAVFGAVGAYSGTAISALAPGLPAGAVIVLVLGVVFLVSGLIGGKRGIIHRYADQHSLTRRIRRQNLLRAIREWEEAASEHQSSAAAQLSYLRGARGWGERELRRTLGDLARRSMVFRVGNGGWHFTDYGRVVAERVMRNHRLWEVYLLEHADIAAAHVDHGADYIEHVLGEELVAELEAELPRFRTRLPESVHALQEDDGAVDHS